VRQIILDTETTGLEISQDHRIIEIGCVELIDRRITDNHWHYYINPDREIEAGAFEVHGISNDSLKDKPRFRDVAQDFINYIEGAELVIHNAPFDVGFLNHEFSKLEGEHHSIERYCRVLDTLVMARQKHPGQKNNLDALCKRYEINNSQRSLHGALLDAQILAEVYLFMTGGQTALVLDESQVESGNKEQTERLEAIKRDGPLPIWRGSAASDQAHLEYLEFIQQQGSEVAWK